MNLFMALNPLSSVDIVFFIIIGVIIAACIAIYFLIPIINKEQYEQARKNLFEREKSFKRNISSNEDKKDSK